MTTFHSFPTRKSEQPHFARDGEIDRLIARARLDRARTLNDSIAFVGRLVGRGALGLVRSLTRGHGAADETASHPEYPAKADAAMPRPANQGRRPRRVA